MSNDKGQAGGKADDQQQEASGNEAENNQQQNQSKDDKVSYETYRKTLEAEKKAKETAKELARKLKEKEDAELQVQGKDKELIESLRSQLKEKESKFESVIGTYAMSAVTSQIKEAASKAGCLDPDLLVAAAKDDFGKIQVDVENGFSVNQDDIKMILEEKMKKHPNLFKKPTPKLKDGVPTNKIEISDEDTGKMSLSDLAKKLAKMNNNIMN